MEMMTINDFAPHKDKIFSAPLLDGSVLALRLTAVEALPAMEKPGHWPQSLPFRDAPFRLTFLGPAEIRLSDGMVSMLDDNGGVLQIGLAAYAKDENGIYYQAIFN
jgi:hypothetical protein